MTRSSPDSVLFTTYNLLDLGAGDPASGDGHYAAVVESIRALGTDVLAVQEICAPGLPAAGRLLRRLGDDTGLRCLVTGPGGQAAPALCPGARGYHLGLLWRDGIEPVPGSFRTRNTDFWHALGWISLDVGGTAVRHAVYHAPPFGRKLRADQSAIVVASLAGPAGRPPVLAGADWNGQGADRVRDPGTGRWELYEPDDPFATVEWFDGMVHQCEWDYDERGQRRHWVDRTAGEVLWAGGLHDAAAVLRAPWQPTAGHYPGDPGAARGIRRRIDGIRVTAEVIPALRGHWVTDTGLTRRASDHLPVTVEYLPAAIAPAASPAPP
ncbi:MAG TPA: endonuclease/exonuclease/phosphatase family protein [Streptosporangiaceae bacterium]|nr:endonuclease/exonuclease/phosphatase family protein [Streptosporangiaceae bacterium]